MALPLPLLLLFSIFVQSQSLRSIPRRMFKRAADQLKYYRVVDEFGGEVSVMRPNCFVEITCDGTNATLALLVNESRRRGDVTFTRSDETTKTTILLLSWSAFGQRFSHFYKPYYYHLCGKEQCREKRCEEGTICIIKNGKQQCSPKGKSSPDFWRFYVMHYYSSNSKEDICSEVNETDTSWEQSTSECTSLLLRGYTPRFATSEKSVCNQSGTFI